MHKIKLLTYEEMWTIAGIRKFFEILGCRAKVVEGMGRVCFWVPRKNFHFVRWLALNSAPMGIFVEIKILRFYECRFKKLQITELKNGSN